MTAEVLLALAFVASLSAALRILPPLHPVQLWLLPWTVASVLLALHLLPYEPMTAKAGIVIALGSMAFCAGALLIGSPPARPDEKRDHARRALRLAAGLSLVVLGLAAMAFVLQVSARFGLRAALVTNGEVRHAIQAGTLALTIKFIYLTFMACALSGAAAGYAETRRERRLWTVLTALAAATAYLSTGRGSIVIAILAGAFGYLLARKSPITSKHLLRGVAVAAVLVFVVFTAGGAVIGKTFSANPVSSVPSVFTAHRALEPFALPYQYATAPLVAFGVQLEVNPRRAKARGCATFTIACQISEAVGLPVRGEPAIEPFTAEPLRWNTYTSLDRPLMDGGPMFVPIAFIVLGAACSLLFRAARRRSPVAVVAYAVVATAILYSSTQMNFFAPYILFASIGASAAVAVALRVSENPIRFGPCAPRGLQRFWSQRLGAGIQGELRATRGERG